MSDCGKKLLLTLFLTLALVACKQPQAEPQQLEATVTKTAADTIDVIGNDAIEQAFKAKKSDVQVSGRGIVTKLLKADNKGARHQKFLVRINPQQVLLFAHNVDLAPEVPLQIGDEISFHGEYVYNPKGGVIHWTHHAPRNDHEAGWIVLNGKKYQ
jgi:hypothetical protein